MNKVVFRSFTFVSHFCSPCPCINSLSCWCVDDQCCRHSTTSFLSIRNVKYLRKYVWIQVGLTFPHPISSHLSRSGCCFLFLFARWDGYDRMQKYTIVSRIKQTREKETKGICARRVPKTCGSKRSQRDDFRLFHSVPFLSVARNLFRQTF